MERYKVEKSVDQNKWICTDMVHNIVIEFEEHKFNETQQITFAGKQHYDVMQIAKLLREMADWLGENHYNKIFWRVNENQ